MVSWPQAVPQQLWHSHSHAGHRGLLLTPLRWHQPSLAGVKYCGTERHDILAPLTIKSTRCIWLYYICECRNHHPAKSWENALRIQVLILLSLHHFHFLSRHPFLHRLLHSNLLNPLLGCFSVLFISSAPVVFQTQGFCREFNSPPEFSWFVFTPEEFRGGQLSFLSTKTRNILPRQETGHQLKSRNPIA